MAENIVAMQDNVAAIAGYWFNAAHVDLDVASEVVARHPQVACFHAQQATEKAFKALLVLQVGDAPRSHMITELIDELSAIGITAPIEIADAARSLQRHYLPSRYPDALGGGDPAKLYSQRDGDVAIRQAQAALAWTESFITPRS